MTVAHPGPCPLCGGRPVVVQTSVHGLPTGAALEVDAVGPVVVGERPVLTLDAERLRRMRAGYLATFLGGYRTEAEIDAFRHGMATVFNGLDSAVAGLAAKGS